ncbi:hypothetical protein [Persicitalea sp.]|uniref:hypothetical protein n=1 Tax=Persicitalea sp. TaxID=3100273 RepID=UPI003592FCE1
MIDSLIPPALKYITDLVLDNEEVKKFPKEFITASMKWISSWFLEDDPVTKTVVNSDSPAVAKEAVLKAKLNELLKNPQFAQELNEHLAAYNVQRSRIKNVAVDAQIEAQGNVHIGDKGTGDTTAYDEKNVIKGGSIKAGKDFHLGDDYTSK